MSTIHLLMFFAAVLVLLVSATSALSSRSNLLRSDSSVSVWATVPLNETQRFTPQTPLNFAACSSRSSAASVVTVDPKMTRQPVVGFGAALTETTAYNFLQLKARNASAYDELMRDLFAPPSKGGIGISFMRVPISACDLSLPTVGWTFDDTPGDVLLEHFNSSHFEAWQMPVLQDAMKLSENKLKLVGSPWSAPSWMKTSNAWGYGRLRDDLYGVYAMYLTKVAQYFKDQNVPLWAMTMQNEPLFEPQSYGGTHYTAQNESMLASILWPLLRSQKIDTLVSYYDHNWDREDFPDEVARTAGKFVDIVAWHCYAGDVSNQTAFHNKWPNIPMIFTECSQTGNENTPRQFLNDFMDNQKTLYFGNWQNWGRSTLHWSLAVNKTGGPHSGGCGTCSGVVVVDAADHSVPYFVKKNSEFYSLSHFSSLVPTDSVYIFTPIAPVIADVSAMAFNTPTGTRVVQLLNAASNAVTVTVQDLQQGCVDVSLPANSQFSLSYSTAAWSRHG